MQDILNENFFDLIRRQNEQKRDAFLLNISPTQDGTCYWNGCNEQARTQCGLVTPSGERECRFCWHHHHKAAYFCMDLARYELPEQGA